MKTNRINVVGVMSGTSLDGLDLCLCEFHQDNEEWHFQIKAAETIAYPGKLEKNLKVAQGLDGRSLTVLDIEVGDFIGESIKSFLDRNSLSAQLIGTHGHTIFHQPQNRLSLQIGNLNSIHAITNIPVVGNFRQLDVFRGGQGAPLVPIGDKLLFSENDFCLNLGGISNLSFEKNGRRLAGDISVCNMALNYLANKMGHTYDRDGELAISGKIDKSLLQDLNALAFYKRDFPKSLGLEDMMKDVLPIIEKSEASIQDKLNTFSHHIAYQIAEVIKNASNSGSLLITGGGAHNRFLIDLLKNYLGKSYTVTNVTKELVDFKEALIFAFLAVLRVNNHTNILSSVTGAQTDSSAGDIIGIKSP